MAREPPGREIGSWDDDRKSRWLQDEILQFHGTVRNCKGAVDWSRLRRTGAGGAMQDFAGMPSLNVHFLDARGALADIRDWIGPSLSATYQRADSFISLRPIDVVVQAGTEVVPEKGHVGYAPRPGIVFVTVDPDSALLRANPNASLERMFAHELHHAARWDGPGYGSSLGEALVSEGLAGHFALEVCGGSPEPWESLDMLELRPHIPLAMRDWDRQDYGHDEWFFGAADLPRWLGYSLGFQLVARFLSERPGYKASNLAEADADTFRGSLTAI